MSPMAMAVKGLMLWLLIFFRKRRRTEKERQVFSKEKYPLLAPCKDNCRMKCITKITEENRKTINDSFWTLDFAQRRLWFDAQIQVHSVQRRKAITDQYSGHTR